VTDPYRAPLQRHTTPYNEASRPGHSAAIVATSSHDRLEELSPLVLASPATSLIASATSGAVLAAGSPQPESPMDGYVDMLLRRNNPSPENTNSAETRRELNRLLTADFRDGAEPSPADRGYIAKVVAARTSLSQAEADQRVSDVITQVKADLDKARRAAMKLSIWLTLSLFIGAFSAALAATEGGGLRDGTWGKKAWLG
jgi:hypothetical protein